MVLPVLGGSPAVWSIALVFFQALLLAGYCYAHLLARYASTGAALALHLGLMLGAALSLPIAIPAGWTSAPADGEAFWLLGLFAVSVGLPFFALAANGPLLQAWFSRSGHPRAADPYFLYAASNVGSFAALVAYSLAVEPLFRMQEQTAGWFMGFVALAVLIGGCGLLGGARWPPRATAPAASAAAPGARRRPTKARRPPPRRRGGGSAPAGSASPSFRPAFSSPSRPTSRPTSPRRRCCGSCRWRCSSSPSSSPSATRRSPRRRCSRASRSGARPWR